VALRTLFVFRVSGTSRTTWANRGNVKPICPTAGRTRASETIEKRFVANVLRGVELVYTDVSHRLSVTPLAGRACRRPAEKTRTAIRSHWKTRGSRARTRPKNATRGGAEKIKF